MEFYTDKLRTIRKQKKLTIDELAQKMGIHRTTYCGWEYGKRIPSEAKIRMLAKVMEISVDQVSDLEPDVPVSNIQITDGMKSLLAMTEDRELQNSNVKILRACLDKVDKQLQDTGLIINALLLSIDSMFYVKDINLNYVTANSAFLKNLSLNKNFSVLGKNDTDFFPIKEAAVNENEDREVFISGKSIINSENYIPGSRKKKWGLNSKIPIFDSKGKVEGVLGSFVDITHRKKTEYMRELLQKAMLNINDVLWVIDSKHKCILFTGAYEKLFGRSFDGVEDPVKFWYEEILHPDDFIKCKKIEGRLFEEGNRLLNKNKGMNSEKPKFVESWMYKIVKPDGKITYIESSYSFMVINREVYSITIDRDVTELAELRDKLAQIKNILDIQDNIPQDIKNEIFKELNK
jgi:transcriptional regulator with XRE-family HTH domain